MIIIKEYNLLLQDQNKHKKLSFQLIKLNMIKCKSIHKESVFKGANRQILAK